MWRWRYKSQLAFICAGVLGMFWLSSCETPTVSAPPPNPAAPSSVSSDADAPPVVVVPGPAEPENHDNNAGSLPSWVPIGPADPADPPPDGWYSKFVDQACDDMAGDDPLVNAARALCVAVTSDTPEAWADAEGLLPAIPVPTASDCLGTATYEVLVNVINYRQTHAGTVAEIRPGEGTACPLGLTGVSLPLGEGSGENVSASPGTQMRLVGRFLDVAQVLLNGQTVPVAKNAENNFTFLVPDSLQDGEVTVHALDSAGAELSGNASFTFLSVVPSSGF